MKIIQTKFGGLEIIKTNIYKDHRGYFKEVFQNRLNKKNKFIFDCMSYSKKNILRGMHIQRKNPQAKIITVAQGEVFDVCVDLRKKSKTYGKYFSIKISQKSNFSILIPPGFAHGFLCLSEQCVVYYKCSKYRHSKSEQTIAWNDPNLKIRWPLKNPLLSKKDNKGIYYKSL
jgi:dTDP-4-dehydrorhamnose 3,5-epimerase